MRGLRLFVRPIDQTDHESVRAFLETHGSRGGLSGGQVAGLSGGGLPDNRSTGQPDNQPTVPAYGLLGKLLGDIVAVVAIDLMPNEIRIDDILVAPELRKKRIGRVMMREVEQLAAKMDRYRVIVEDARGADEFFRHVGFRNEGERWVRDVSS
jgi:GNAT superfamily N-acetyltransferase